MFVMELTYRAPLDTIETLLPEHLAWLDKHYADGTFVVSGRKQPREGGIVIAAGSDRAAVERIAAEDPFAAAGAAEYRIVEFIAHKTAPGLEEYRQPLPS